MPILQEIQTRKKYRTMWIVALVLVLFGGIWYAGYVFWYQKTINTPSENIPDTTQSGTLSPSIESDGKVLYKDVYDIDFPVSGTLREVLKKKGDMVKKGEVLARLDETSARIALERAEIAVRSAEATLQARKTGKTSPGDIKLSATERESSVSRYTTINAEMQTQIDTARKSLESALLSKNAAEIELTNTETSVIKDVNSAKLTVDARNVDYQAAKDLLSRIASEENEKRENLRQQIALSIETSLTNLTQYLYDVDVFLGVTDANRSKNDTFEMYIAAKNTSLKTSAENSFRATSPLLEDFHRWWDTAKMSSGMTETRAMGWKNIQLIDATIATLDLTTEAVRNSITSSNFIDANITAYISAFQTSIATLQTKKQFLLEANQAFDMEETIMKNRLQSQQDIVTTTLSELDIANSTLARTLATSNTSLSTARSKLELAIKQHETAEEQYKNTQLTADSTLKEAQKQIDIANASLSLKREPVSDDELRPLRVAIESARKDVQDAKRRLADMVLISPADGILSEINGLPRETISIPATEAFMTIVDIAHPYIEARIEELDIGKIYLGQPVRITFDAIEKTTFSGSVRFVSDTSSIDENEIVSYLVEIAFDPGQSGVREGMTATIEYFTKEH